jgi:hypothetical protein
MWPLGGSTHSIFILSSAITETKLRTLKTQLRRERKEERIERRKEERKEETVDTRSCHLTFFFLSALSLSTIINLLLLFL